MAAPAAVALFGGVVLTVVLATGSERKVASRYESEASEALVAGDYSRARICFERLLQSQPDNPAFLEGLKLAMTHVSR